MQVVPRPPPKFLMSDERPKTPWDFKKSIFKTYIPDNEMNLNDCFENDWNDSKIQKILKNPAELVTAKAYLRQIYKPIREIYKYYAGIATTNGIPSIG